MSRLDITQRILVGCVLQGRDGMELVQMSKSLYDLPMQIKMNERQVIQYYWKKCCPRWREFKETVRRCGFDMFEAYAGVKTRTIKSPVCNSTTWWKTSYKTGMTSDWWWQSLTGECVASEEGVKMVRFTLGESLCSAKLSKQIKMLIAGSVDDRDVFPLKGHIGAVTKVNVFMSDAVKDARLVLGDDVCQILLEMIYMRRACTGRCTYNDEACSWLLWCVAALEGGLNPVPALLVSYDDLKEMSNDLKGCGVVCNPFAHMLVEMAALEGRGIGMINIENELRKRTDPESFEGMLAKFNAEDLTRVVRQIVREERGVIVCPDWKRSWANRFATTKAGSHNVWAGQECSLPKQQLTRRNYVEAVDYMGVDEIEPRGYVSMSQKLEQGKGRAIYALDSDNYLRFDPPARAVEQAWRNKRVVLAPSGEDQVQDTERRGKQLRKWKLMFDYKDFNSAHTTEAQKIVVREIFDFLPEKWLRWLVDSFDNHKIKHPTSSELLHVKGTLMSGHRLTTIINTVLNGAYVRLVLGEDLYSRLHWEHVGDDVVASTDDADTADTTIGKLMASDLQLQRNKQGFGRWCAEFLRISYDGHIGTGYLARAIASGTCGSWVTDLKLDSSKYIVSVLQIMWTLRQRSQGYTCSLLFTSTIARRLGLSYEDAWGLATGRVSLNGSPVFGSNSGNVVHIKYGQTCGHLQVSRKVRGIRLPRKAATDYAANSTEYSALVKSGVHRAVLDRAMLEASYSNLFERNPDRGQQTEYSEISIDNRWIRPLGYDTKIAKNNNFGALANLLGSAVSDEQWLRFGDIIERDVSTLTSYGNTEEVVVSSVFGTPYSSLRYIAKVIRQNCIYTTVYKLML
uniref:RdRp n=1 Tax=viral metagenome TaxID=1070528 RepID=A0A2V0RJ97_9ZZZZ